VLLAFLFFLTVFSSFLSFNTSDFIFFNFSASSLLLKKKYFNTFVFPVDSVMVNTTIAKPPVNNMIGVKFLSSSTSRVFFYYHCSFIKI